MDTTADALAELAQATQAPRARRAVEVPDYGGIVSSARTLRVAAFVVMLVGAMLIVAGVGGGVLDTSDINGTIQERTEAARIRKLDPAGSFLDTRDLVARREWRIAESAALVV